MSYTSRCETFKSSLISITGIGKRSKATPNIVHPIFGECSELVEDGFWKKVFVRAAQGKFPKNFSYKNGLLVYKLRNKFYRLSLPSETDPVEALHMCIEFMKKTANMLSEEDKEQNMLDNEENRSDFDIMTCSWQDIKKKKMRKLLMINFASKINDEHGYGDLERVVDFLNISFILGKLENADVVFNGGEIKSIHGLTIDSEGCVMIEDRLKKGKKSSSGTKAKTPYEAKTMGDKWEELLVYLRGKKSEQNKKKQIIDEEHMANISHMTNTTTTTTMSDL